MSDTTTQRIDLDEIERSAVDERDLFPIRDDWNPDPQTVLALVRAVRAAVKHDANLMNYAADESNEGARYKAEQSAREVMEALAPFRTETT